MPSPQGSRRDGKGLRRDAQLPESHEEAEGGLAMSPAA